LTQAPKKRSQAVGVGRIADEELHSVVVQPILSPRPRHDTPRTREGPSLFWGI